MKIAGLQRVSLLDFPGKIAASLFLAGCNLNCGFCHNRWMIDEAEVVESLSLAAFLEWLGTRQGLLDGVCISGGEPTLHTELPELLRKIRALGFATKLDTNGTLPERLDDLLREGLLDYVAMDIKAPLDGRYDRQAGCLFPLDALRQSLALLRHGNTEYELRTTVAPGLTLTDLEAIAEELLPEERWHLQPYRATEDSEALLRGEEAMGNLAIIEAAARLAATRPLVRVRGA